MTVARTINARCFRAEDLFREHAQFRLMSCACGEPENLVIELHRHACRLRWLTA